MRGPPITSGPNSRGATKSLRWSRPRAFAVASWPSCRVVVVQEWIEGQDSDIFFCLQYRATGGATVCSFTGRKLCIWPPDVGTTASCTAAAPEVRTILQPLTEAFFKRMSLSGWAVSNSREMAAPASS